ncbi:MAG: hypothetical protein IJ228_00470 [Succinivibrio sp.]|nr:hypothetical protein [Succinivibrio sp.]
MEFAREKHRIYQKTFLFYAGATVLFPEIDDSFFDPQSAGYNDREQRFCDFAVSTFGVDEEGSKKMFRRKLATLDILGNCQGRIWFGNKNSGVIMRGDGYTGFSQEILPRAFFIRSYLTRVLELDKITSLKVRKFNVWSVKTKQSELPDKNVVLDGFISNPLREKAGSGAGTATNEVEVPGLLNFAMDKAGSFKVQQGEGCDLGIGYGFLRDQSTDKSDEYLTMYLYLDAAQDMRETDYRSDAYERSLEDLNQLLFDAFHWSVSKNVLRVMRG